MHPSIETLNPAETKADYLALGSPRFSNPTLENICRQDGIAAAWREALRETGILTPAAVLGDFAIALREPDNKVFMAVDRFAIHSLCYRQIGNTLRFAERADELADATTEIDPQAIFEYLYFHAIPSPRTIYKGIYRIPPAHYVLFEKTRLTVAPYWIPKFEENPHQSFDQLRADFLRLLRQATKRQLDNGKAACFLSGGTDSSTVAGMIGEVAGQPGGDLLHRFRGRRLRRDGRLRASPRSASAPNTTSTTSRPTTWFEASRPWRHTTTNRSATPPPCPPTTARRWHAKMALPASSAGDGGDELFGGNARYAKQRIFGCYRQCSSRARARVLSNPPRYNIARHAAAGTKGRQLRRAGQVPMPDRMQMYNLLLRLGSNSVLTPDLPGAGRPWDPLHQQREVWRRSA